VTGFQVASSYYTWHPCLYYLILQDDAGCSRFARSLLLRHSFWRDL